MLWLDSVAAVPLIGVRVEPQWVRSIRYPEIIAPLADEWHASGMGCRISQPQPGVMTVERDDGFIYKLTPTDVVVDFKYPAHQQRKPGTPQPEYAPVHVRPYSDILTDLENEAARLLELVSSAGPLRFIRFGVAASCRMPPDDAPPGVQSLIAHMGSPWEKPLRTLKANLLAILRETEHHFDQCHHTTELDNSTANPELTLLLDWQRVIRPSSELQPRYLRKCVKAACSYFEEVAEGVGDL